VGDGGERFKMTRRTVGVIFLVLTWSFVGSAAVTFQVLYEIGITTEGYSIVIWVLFIAQTLFYLIELGPGVQQYFFGHGSDLPIIPRSKDKVI